MTRLQILSYIIIMFFTVASYAQEKQGNVLQWRIPTELPGMNGNSRSLGFAGPVTGVTGDRFIVAGGANFPDSMPWLGGRKKYYSDVYMYTKGKKGLVFNKKIFKLPFSIAYAAVCSSAQGVIYAGGENEHGISNKTVLLWWNEKTANIQYKNLPDLPVALTNASATISGDVVYVAGGETSAFVSNKLYCLDIADTSKGWKKLTDIPKPVSHAVLVTLSNNDHVSLYLIGGRKKNANCISDIYNSVLEFNVKENKWHENISLPYSVAAGTGIAVDSKYILAFGGDKGETFHQSETINSAINAEEDEIKKQQLIQQKVLLLSSHPGFSNDVLLYNSLANKWSIVGHIPFDSPVTTTAVKWGDCVIIPSGEIRAGVRTSQVLIGKINLKDK